MKLGIASAEKSPPRNDTYIIGRVHAQTFNRLAADDYHSWNSKADAYVAVLTVMAVAFFLLGLAQAVKGRIRLTFAIFGFVILFGASAWAALTLIT